jgi:hypothetical protein
MPKNGIGSNKENKNGVDPKNSKHWKRAGTIDKSLINRIQEMKTRISGVKDTIEEIDTSVKEYAKCKKILNQNIQEICDTIKGPYLRVRGIGEGEGSKCKLTENIFNKIIEENYFLPNIKISSLT